ncbi:MAG: hypothetical protein IPN13_08070 [Bacteroidetes bacterium]|nr:hypothetical protein [Bacteroidota bacterium]
MTSSGAKYTVDLIVAGIGVVPNSELAEQARAQVSAMASWSTIARTSDP